MDENKPMDEQTPAPEPTPAPAPTPAPQPSYAAGPSMGGTTGGPVPFSSSPDPSVPQEEKLHGLLSWVLSIVIGFLSPLIFFLISKDKPFVKHHAASGLTMCILFFCVYVVFFVLALVVGPLALVLFPIIGLMGLCALIFLVMGAIAANAGSRCDPPLIRTVREAIFKV
jgi:uncharacterized membrane protein